MTDAQAAAYNGAPSGTELDRVVVFLDAPTDGPAEAADCLAEQLGIADASVLKTYGSRENKPGGRGQTAA
ncbi:hypothetical protein [Streptomyces sp. NPDC049915]|uniref:hypothetical protein n=1 Tax=Streptomyces sp. NPDC049915 TaxID=3155510 RepID=UPI003414421F